MEPSYVHAPIDRHYLPRNCDVSFAGVMLALQTIGSGSRVTA
jgi:hypothetical protein